MQQTQETWFNPWVGKNLEEAVAAHSSILGWENPMEREAWRATGHKVHERVGHNWVTRIPGQREDFKAPRRRLKVSFIRKMQKMNDIRLLQHHSREDNGASALKTLGGKMISNHEDHTSPPFKEHEGQNKIISDM